MCCLFSTLFLLGPRAAVVVWWIMDPTRWNLAFSSWLWPVIGFFIAPWTTLMWVIVAPGGVQRSGLPLDRARHSARRRHVVRRREVRRRPQVRDRLSSGLMV